MHIYKFLRKIKVTSPLVNIQLWGSVTSYVEQEHNNIQKLNES